MNVLIVDDEQDARDYLTNILKNYCDDIQTIYNASDISSAVKIINNNLINVVFLDIEMPFENGFKLFEYFENPKFETIFCTAYSNYAIDAFKVSALDYILKPASIQDIKQVLDRVQKSKQKNIVPDIITNLQSLFSSEKTKKLSIVTSNGTLFISTNDIQYIEADGSYTKIYTLEQTYMTSKKIKEYEILLRYNSNFIRVHRSFIVNVNKIIKYSKTEGFLLEIQTNDFIPVGREKKQEVEELIKKISI
ncbi:LytR/AlgR family response regulator transcription factor [Flavobacterium sp.]|jgi:two-component system LytT family response regulator|uniref:LytR/AlgR family response regulator transcription factor n=1 Tax=Flavobacterium sp. TaxID=239 RepID=UPI0037C1293E